MEEVLIGQTFKVNVVFLDSNSEPVDPDSVDAFLLDDEQNVVEVLTPENDGVGSYSVDVEFLQLGQFTVKFEGLIDSSIVSVEREFLVVHPEPRFLSESYEFNFLTELTPFFVDPEEFTVAFSDATLVEISQLIFRFSNEVVRLLKLKPPYEEDKIPYVAFEYIRAAVECALSRRYLFDMAGDESALTLGDLTIRKSNNPRYVMTRANATNPCELAEVLRLELLRGDAGMKAVVKGSAYPKKYPPRDIKGFR